MSYGQKEHLKSSKWRMFKMKKKVNKWLMVGNYAKNGVPRE